MMTAIRHWRRFGASSSTAARLARAGLRPLWGGAGIADLAIGDQWAGQSFESAAPVPRTNVVKPGGFFT